VDRMMTTKRHFEDAEVTGYEGLAPAMTNDPKDLHVLAAAIERYTAIKGIILGTSHHAPANSTNRCPGAGRVPLPPVGTGGPQSLSRDLEALDESPLEGFSIALDATSAYAFLLDPTTCP
jgi:hypothetical protein